MLLRGPSLALLAALTGCDPEPLPSARAVAEAAEPAPPTLARALYDAPVAPSPTAREQRVRLLLWLRRLELDRSQLDRLDALRRLALDQRARVAEAEAGATARIRAETDPIFEELWRRLAAGEAPDDPELVALARSLADYGGGGPEGRVLLSLRLEGVRLVLEAERELLETLSPTQEARLVEALFVLRRRLDPVGTPGDFDLLVGPSFEPGAPALLLRGTTQGIADPLDLGGLWAASGTVLPEARREAILYLALLEPGLDEAIAAARALAL